MSEINGAIADDLEKRLLLDAALLAQAAARKWVEQDRILRDFWFSYETRSAVIPIAEINAAWESYEKLKRYQSLATELVHRYLRVPGFKERLGTFFRSIVPFAQKVETLKSIQYSNKHLGKLSDLREDSVRGIHKQALLSIRTGKRRSRTELGKAGFFQPRIVKPLQDIRISENALPQRLEVRDYFAPKGDNLTYIALSNDASVAVARTKSTGSSVIIITPKGVGSTSVVVELINLRGLNVTQSFMVTVEEVPDRNQQPILYATIPEQTLNVWDPLPPLDLSNYFRDPDGDILTYSVWPNPKGIVKLKREGSQITITPIKPGSTVVMVKVTDTNDLQRFARISVTVIPPRTTGNPPDANNPSNTNDPNADVPLANIFPDVSGIFPDIPPPDVSGIFPDIPPPDVSGIVPDVSGIFPDIPPPDVSGIFPDVSGIVPDIPPPDVSGIVPDVSGIVPDIPPPDVSGIVPDVSGIVPDIPPPDVSGIVPDISGIVPDIPPPDVSGIVPDIPPPDVSGIVPDVSGIFPDIPPPDVSGIVPDVSGIVPDISGIVPDISGIVPDISGIVPDISGIVPDVSGIVPDVSGIVPDVSGIVPDVSGIVPDIPPPVIPSVTVPSFGFGPIFGGRSSRTEDICDRTQQVLNAILATMDVDDCANLESEDLDSITTLVLSEAGITALKEDDFEGFSGLVDLDLHGNSLTSLPVGVFNGLRALENLDLQNNSLNSLPVGVFDDLDALESLNLKGNSLTTLLNGIFDDVLDTLESNSLVLDDSLKTTLDFSVTAQDAAEGDTVRVAVTLGHSLPVALRVPYTIGGTATAKDYKNLKPLTELLFLAGQTRKEIVLTLLEDADTGAETVSLTLGALNDVKVRPSDGTGPDAKLSGSTLLTVSRRVHTITVTADGNGIQRPMYWTGGDQRIYRSQLDGTYVQVLFEGGKPQDIALDVLGNRMYWVDTEMNVIQWTNLDGTGVVNMVSEVRRPKGLALDVAGGKIYWTDIWTNKIQRANLDGSGIEDLVTGLDRPERIALDVSRSKMYWTDAGTQKIQRANLNGKNVEDLVSGLSSPTGLALDVSRSKIYWKDTETNKIQRANLNGKDVKDIVTDIDMSANGLALDVSRSKMYWTDAQRNKVYRANLNGSRIEEVYSGGHPIGIAIAVESDVAVNAAPRMIDANGASLDFSETVLLPNYPNPFNPETWIPYQLSKPADVNISIYAIDGKLVRTLVLGHQPVGVYESRSRAAYWDGKNGLGEPVASGVYFYTLTTGDFSATRKMLIRK